MAGVNKAILVGHLGRDPEIRTTQSGTKVATFSLATSESWRDKATGERKDKTEWHHVVIFNENLVKIAEQYLKKGAKVYIEGQIATRKYTDQGGIDRWRTEIVLAQFRGAIAMLDRAERAPPPEEDNYGSRASAGGAPATGSRRDDLDDEIPF